MAKVKGTNKRTRPKRSYKKPGSKKGRGVRQTWKNLEKIIFRLVFYL